jgi:hypothetical protein
VACLELTYKLTLVPSANTRDARTVKPRRSRSVRVLVFIGRSGDQQWPNNSAEALRDQLRDNTSLTSPTLPILPLQFRNWVAKLGKGWYVAAISQTTVEVILLLKAGCTNRLGVVCKSIFGSHRICRWFTAANIGIGKSGVWI